MTFVPRIRHIRRPDRTGAERASAALAGTTRQLRLLVRVIAIATALSQSACGDEAPATADRSPDPPDRGAAAGTDSPDRASGSATAAPAAVPGAPPAHYDRPAGHHGQIYQAKGHVGSFAWTDEQWQAHCRGVRTSYNPDHELNHSTLTLTPDDPRWLDFVFWSLSNKLNEHQIEAFGGTGWRGPKTGVIFHWAPGSHWEHDSVHSFGFVIGHTIGEHRWTDTMFPDFFEPYGGTYGVNVKDRLAEIAPRSSAPWAAFLAYIGGPQSPYGRYVLHIDSSVDLAGRQIALAAGQGIAFTYSFDRYYEELAAILTDCSAFQFFQMYDRFGPGFAAEGNWAHQAMPEAALSRIGYVDRVRGAPGSGSGRATAGTSEPASPARVAVPADLPEADRMKRGEAIYFKQCAACHGETGDGAGFLAEGLDVKPQDLRQGQYKFRSTPYGELPAMADIERTVRDGVPGTTMPAWGQFLTDEEIGDVARYLVVLSPRLSSAWRSHQEPPRLPIAPVPREVTELSSHPTGDPHPCSRAPRAASYACKGEKRWGEMLCRWCHGNEGRGDGESARSLTDGSGRPIRPTDLTYKWLFKNGHRPRDVYRSVFGGLNGTPMQPQLLALGRAPLSAQERWEIVAYVLSLSPPARPVLHLNDFAAQRATRIGPDGRVTPERPGGSPVQ